MRMRRRAMWSTGRILVNAAKWWSAISILVTVPLLIGGFRGPVDRSIFLMGMIIFGWIPAGLAYATAQALCYFGTDSPYPRFRSHNFLMTHEVRYIEKGAKRSAES